MEKSPKTTPTRSYFTHDNGGRPFLVQIGKDGVHVTKAKGGSMDDYTIKVLHVPHPVNVWVGKSPKNKMTLFSGGHGAKFTGNSILVQTDEVTYVFIGDMIYSFTVPAGIEIVEFLAPVGNNDVPYAYAVDNHGDAYLLSDGHVRIPMTKGKDPYESFYSEDKKKMKKNKIQIKMIHKRLL